MDLLGLGRGRGTPGADRPHRLVGDHEPLAASAVVGSRPPSAPASCALDHAERSPGVALGERSRRRTRSRRARRRAPRVPSCRHPRRCRRRTGGARCGRRSPRSRRRRRVAAPRPRRSTRRDASQKQSCAHVAIELPSRRLATAAQRGERRRDADRDALDRAELVLELGDEGDGLGDRLVELPVADHERSAHAVVISRGGYRVQLTLKSQLGTGLVHRHRVVLGGDARRAGELDDALELGGDQRADLGGAGEPAEDDRRAARDGPRRRHRPSRGSAAQNVGSAASTVSGASEAGLAPNSRANVALIVPRPTLRATAAPGSTSAVHSSAPIRSRRSTHDSGASVAANAGASSGRVGRIFAIPGSPT